jgi:hypothetical protein
MFRSRRLAISLLLSACLLLAAVAGALAASHGLSGRGSVTAAPASSGRSAVKVVRVAGFGVDPRVLIYTTTVVVTGLRGDQATITTAGTP